MRVLAIGAHPDDIEIGVAGTIKKHTEAGDDVVFLVMTQAHNGGGTAKARTEEAKIAAEILGVRLCLFLDYEDTKLPDNFEVIEKIEEVVKIFNPDRVYIPYHNEIHQDHRSTNKASIAACRNVKQVLMYEGPSTFNDFQANFCVDISKQVDAKINAIKAHVSQGEKEILKIDAILGINKFRGYQTRCQLAEGFSVFKYLE